MIVDDHAAMRSLIRGILTEVATEIVECADGAEALARYATERPDWTLMDLAMGNIDGLTATRQLRSQFPEAHIMIVSQHNTPILRERAREAGAEKFLSKENLVGLPSALAEAQN